MRSFVNMIFFILRLVFRLIWNLFWGLVETVVVLGCNALDCAVEDASFEAARLGSDAP